MTPTKSIYRLLGIGFIAQLLLSSCSTTPPPPATQPQELSSATEHVAKGGSAGTLYMCYKPNSYKHYVAYGTYPKTMKVYRNEALLKKSTGKSPIYIDLSQQRGRLYVGKEVAMDWPVSTGVSGKETPVGHFRISQKKANHRSNMYGKTYSADGKIIDYNASSKDPLAEGASFVGAPMPFWQRMTGCGIGMHIGRVRVGRRLSHGCIRTPSAVAKELFKTTKSNTTYVTVVNKTEAPYPAKEVLELKAKAKAMAMAKKAKEQANAAAAKRP